MLVSAGLGLSLYSSLDCKFLVSSEFQCIEFLCFHGVPLTKIIIPIPFVPGGSTRFHSKELSKR